MGWLGASDRNLAKYGQVLTSLGTSHLRTIMPSEHVFWPFDGGARLLPSHLFRQLPALGQHLSAQCLVLECREDAHCQAHSGHPAADGAGPWAPAHTVELQQWRHLRVRFHARSVLCMHSHARWLI